MEEELDFGASGSQGAAKTQKRRRNVLTHQEKVALIASVKAHSCIWSLVDARHSDTTAVNAAWKEIATELQKTVEECKLAWNSLKDSRRYYASISKKKKSGDDGGDAVVTQIVTDSGEWEYNELLSFLPNVASKRRTFTSTNFGSGSLENDSSNSSYSYISTPQKSRLKDSQSSVMVEESNDDKIVKSIEDLIQARHIKNTKHAAPINYIQHLLQKLPDDRAETLTIEFITKLQSELEKK